MLKEKWHESKIDPDIFLQLQDLAAILADFPNIRLKFSNTSFVQVKTGELTLSSLWDSLEDPLRLTGYKTDLYLRALGTLHRTELPSLKNLSVLPARSFQKQIFTLLEDLRLEERIKRKRPGTLPAFTERRKYLRSYFASQLRMNRVRGYLPDQLFSALYLLLAAEGPSPNLEDMDEKLVSLLNQIKPLLFESFESTTTEELSFLTERLSLLLPKEFQQLHKLYFAFPIQDFHELSPVKTIADQLKRTDDVENQDLSDEEAESDYFDECLESWHQESTPSEKQQSFLQMDLELGTKTGRKGKTARQTESADQVFATAQGAARRSKQKDYDKLLAAEEETRESFAGSNKDFPYGRENTQAVALWQKAKAPSQEEGLAYQEILSSIEKEKRRLLKLIEKLLEHKRESPRNKLHYGRLDKNLLPLVTEDLPRLFYKKDQESRDFDAVFSLLIDCSASMDQKMPEVKRGIALFHEVLKNLRIRHSITGFWEGASSSLSKEQPNYFLDISAFEDSLDDANGAKIMQLSAEEDNRDGFSVRIIADLLFPRREKQKVLLVFTDGEPAADGYFENGIVDTKMAVSELRRRGILVLGVFLAEGVLQDEDRRLMEVIYGRDYLMVRDLRELPDLLSSVLRRLLLSSL